MSTYKNWSKEEERYLRDNYLTQSREITAEYLCRTPDAVCHKARSLGLKYNRLKPSYVYDTTFFENPNPINSYWAGYIASDGCISLAKNRNYYSTLILNISTKDEAHLKIFQQDIKSNHKLSYSRFKPHKSSIVTNKDKYYETARLALNGFQLNTNFLKTHFNITPKKTLTLEPPPNLNFDHSLAFIKGYLDGDGSITFRKEKRYPNRKPILQIKILGTSQFLEWIQEICQQICPDDTVGGIYPRSHNKAYSYEVSRFAAYKIGKTLESSVDRGLDRKWLKIKEADSIYSLVSV